MKLFFIVLFMASIAVAKNKVVYTSEVRPGDPKKPPIYDLFVLSDFKSPNPRMIDRGRFSFVTSSDVIAYIREGNSEHKLFIITNFITLNKIEIASGVDQVRIQNNSLFYTQNEKVNERIVRNLYVITDFKTLVKYKVQGDINSFELDSN